MSLSEDVTGAAAAAAAPGRTGLSTELVRTLGWGVLAVMLVFLLNNLAALQLGAPRPGLSGPGPIAALAVHAAAVVATFFAVRATWQRTLRQDAAAITGFNIWLVRAAFFAVLFVGLGDAVISFLRVEQMLADLIGADLESQLGRSNFRGPYVHVPLMVLGVLVASVTRTLGFTWLALMIVLAELLIVISRFVFSYEQAFMADLVRFWYAALFLFASAYTLLEDGHVRVDVFYAGFGPTTKGMVNAVGAVALGITLCWTILIMGLAGPASIINAPILAYESTQSGVGMYVKYMMAGFLGMFAVSMMIQFCASLLESVADWRGEPGKRQIDAPVAT